MIRSYPPFSAQANEYLKFHLSEQKSHLPDPQEETQSIQSGVDSESISSLSECYEENRPSFIENSEDRPLNLSCKRRKVQHEDLQQEPERKASIEAQNIPSKSILLPAMHPALSSSVLEQAMLNYQAQVLASNDILKALAHKRWEESVGLQRSLLPPVSFGPSFHPWLAANALSSYQHYQHLMHPVTSTNAVISHSLPTKTSDERKTPPLQTNFSNPSSIKPVISDLQPASPTAPINLAPSVLSGAYDLTSASPKLAASNPEKTDFRLPSPFPQQDNSSLSPLSSSSLSPNQSLNDGARKRKRSRRSEGKTGEKYAYPCSICGASYPHKFELNRHVKVSHVRPHRCTQCGKGFGHRNYLKVHIETVHLGQKSHQCRLCGKYLSTGGNLNVHVRTIHFGEKKYNCPVCNRSFGQQCNMKTHMKRHYSKSE